MIFLARLSDLLKILTDSNGERLTVIQFHLSAPISLLL